LKVLAASLQKEINSLKETQKDMTNKIKSFDHKYNSILRNVEGFKKNMEEQDALMKDIMSFMSKQSK
jgi:osomolarity two-component system response regulator SKN7